MHDAGIPESAYPELNPILLDLERLEQKADVTSVPRAVGRLLSVLVHGMQANRILEIGTGYGYATLWMALAQPPIGKIWTFDPDIERTRVALTYFKRAGEEDNIEIINQPALEVLPIFPQRNMDIAFIDAPIDDYGAYLELCMPLLKLSGFIMFNGMLQSASSSFQSEFLQHPDLDAAILPLGSGLGIGARKR